MSSTGSEDGIAVRVVEDGKTQRWRRVGIVHAFLNLFWLKSEHELARRAKVFCASSPPVPARDGNSAASIMGDIPHRILQDVVSQCECLHRPVLSIPD